MLITASSKRLFHLALKLYFGCSMILFIWYGSKLKPLPSNQNEVSLKRSVSVMLRISMHEKKDDLNTKNYSITQKSFYNKNISNGANDGNLEEEMGENLEDYPEKVIDVYPDNSNDSRADLKEDVNHEDILTGTNSTKKERLIKWRKLIKEQVALYNHSVVFRAKTADVFYISAISSHMRGDVTNEVRDNSITHTVTVNGWKGKKAKTGKLFCCFKGNNSTSINEVSKINYWDVPDIKIVQAVQYHCNMSEVPFKGKQVYVGLNEKPTCQNTEYIQVEPEHNPPSQKNVSFAVCAKIVYGNFSALRLMEWFEVNKAFGVDNISLFTYNVTKEMINVLNHYQNEGFLHVKEFDFPLKSRFPRFLGQKYMMAYMDEQVTVFDCIQRFRQYTYIAIIDVDEFIMPKFGQTSYKIMMEKLLGEYKNAAGFTLMTSLFVMDWNKTFQNADFTIGAYTLRTHPIWDRRKSILVTERIDLSSVWTHGFHSLKDYNRVPLFSKSAVIYHYRKCRSQWIATDTCFTNRRKYKDATMKVYLGRIRDKLLEMKKTLHLS
ncbi:uncharacterized protein LOC132726946 [Ruditapes philippinarum]|uniref:uncharacterized protein LOC132726946 n=1 Tax=Ruditapes philippinarum TaxID=129788 RepID=UPI00295BFABB|nr:uncharacterized protein LOC132726946 [Ruditapes philippinarum]